MTQQTRATLYTYFQTGDKPTQSQFTDLIDSCLNLATATSQTVSGGAAFGGLVTASTPTQFDSSTNLATTLFIKQNDPGGFVNKFRNAAMMISQRGTSGTVTTASDLYTIDGWILSAVGANITWTQNPGGFSTAPVESYYSMIITGASSNTDVKIYQRLESVDSASLANQQATFQFTITNNSGVTLTPSFNATYPNSTDNWGGSTTTDFGTVNMQPIGNGVTATVAYTFPVSINAINGYEITVDLKALGATKTLQISSFDLRATPGVPTGLNASPPPVEFTPVGVEMARNQRWLVGFGESTGIIGLAYATSTTAFGVYLPFRTKTRSAPSALSITTPGDFEIVDMTGSNVAAVTGLTFQNASRDGAFITGTVASGLSNGTVYQLKCATALAGNLVISGIEF